MDSDTQRGARHAPFDEESMFALLVKAIKRFLARLCQGFAPISSSPVQRAPKHPCTQKKAQTPFARSILRSGASAWTHHCRRLRAAWVALSQMGRAFENPGRADSGCRRVHAPHAVRSVSRDAADPARA